MATRGRPTDTKMREKAMELRLKGLTYAEIGAALYVSRQRAQQLTRPEPGIYNMVRDRAESKCEDCGVELAGGHVHHKDQQADNYNDVSNLAYLCLGCHAQQHTTAFKRQTRQLHDGPKRVIGDRVYGKKIQSPKETD